MRRVHRSQVFDGSRLGLRAIRIIYATISLFCNCGFGVLDKIRYCRIIDIRRGELNPTPHEIRRDSCQTVWPR